MEPEHSSKKKKKKKRRVQTIEFGTYVYWYDEDTRAGELLDSMGNEKIFVKDVPWDKNFPLQGLPIKQFEVQHPNYVQPLFYNSEKKHLIYPHPQESIKEHVERTIKKPFLSYDIPKNDPPCVKRICHSYMVPECRKLIRAMFEFLLCIHKLGFSLKGCTLDNVRWWEGAVRFIGVDFCVGLRTTRRADFATMENMINELFSDHHGVLDNFLTILRSLDGLNDLGGYVMTRHLSIMPPNEVIKFVVRCCERVSYKFMLEDYYDLLESSWFLEKFKITDEDHLFNGDETLCKLSLLTCARNVAAHYKEEEPQKNDVNRCLDLSTECAIMYLFMEQIYDIHKCMADMGLLRRFMDG